VEKIIKEILRAMKNESLDLPELTWINKKTGMVVVINSRSKVVH